MNKFIKILPFAERYLSITHAKNKRIKERSSRSELADGKMPIKKEKMYSYLIKILSVWARWLEKHEPFS